MRRQSKQKRGPNVTRDEPLDSDPWCPAEPLHVAGTHNHQFGHPSWVGERPVHAILELMQGELDRLLCLARELGVSLLFGASEEGREEGPAPSLSE